MIDAGTQQRAQNVKAALDTARLAGQAPSPQLVKLLSEYQAGHLSTGDVVEKIRAHYLRNSTRLCERTHCS